MILYQHGKICISGTHMLEATHSCLIRSNQESNHGWYWKPSQLTRASEVTREDFIVATSQHHL